MNAALERHPSGWAYGPPSTMPLQRKIAATGVYQF
jgi:hypothetical protein